MKTSRHYFLALFFSLIFIFESGFLVIGHRGNPSKYPEETIQSDNSAFADGADYVELDLHVSKDNVLVVSHDRDLSRVVGSSVIVSQNNFSYLNTLKQANGESIISLDQLFDYYKDKPNTKFLLETKKTKHNSPKNMEELLAASIKKYHMQDRVMIHSFSAPSLKTMSQLLPDVPRIFIVGSFQRINFEVLSYVNGINISSDLITQNPKLISQLHALHQKVFVWAEMNETPKLWNWLINNDVDGVVTNFPAKGYKYKLAKTGTKKYDVNKDGIYFGRMPTAISENPYLKVTTSKELNFLDPVHVSSAVIASGQTFYQIGDKEFVPADLVSLDLQPEWILPYWNLSIINPTQNPIFTYNKPDKQSGKKNRLMPRKHYKILGVSGGVKDLWLLTNDGWVKSSKVLYYGLFNKNTFAYKNYQKLDPAYRQTNVALFPYLPVEKVPNKSFWSTYSDVNAVIFNQR